jgi:hypothetical protein
MSDLVLTNEGDLSIIKRSNNAFSEEVLIEGIFDLEKTNSYTKDLVMKAIKTPKGTISLFVLQELNILIKDANYGSEVYRELSEGITLNFLSRVKAHITQSLINANLNNNVADILVGVQNYNTIQLIISYTDSNQRDNIQINI